MKQGRLSSFLAAGLCLLLAASVHSQNPGESLLQEVDAALILQDRVSAGYQALAQAAEGALENRSLILARLQDGSARNAEIRDHNARIDELVERCQALSAELERAMRRLIDLEEDLYRQAVADREGLLQASNDSIVALEDARRALASLQGELQGAVIYRPR